MKPSRYNIFVAIPGGPTLAFNSASTALAEIESDKFESVQKLLDRPDEAATAEERQFLAALVQGKFLIDGQVNELAHLKVRNQRLRFGKGPLMLSIAPTLGCNLRCKSCDDVGQSAGMTKSTEKAIVRFAETRLRGSEGLAVSWFGGEPLLQLETIERLQDEFREICARLRVSIYGANVVTNGLLLDGPTTARLEKAGVLAAQVTLDEPSDVTGTSDGGDAFGRVLDNVVAAAELLKVTLRIVIANCDNASVAGLLARLEHRRVRQRVNLQFEPKPTTTVRGVCSDLCGLCANGEKVAEAKLRLQQALVANGYPDVEYPRRIAGNYCDADSDNALLIAPAGDLFKCWLDIAGGRERAVGSVFDLRSDARQTANLEHYLSWDPFEKAGCRSCEILPLCMGGCPREGLGRNPEDVGECSTWKYLLAEMLQLRHQCDQNSARKEVNS